MRRYLQRPLCLWLRKMKKKNIAVRSLCFYFAAVFRISSREKPPAHLWNMSLRRCATYFKWGSKSDLYQRGRSQQRERDVRLSSQRLRQRTELPAVKEPEYFLHSIPCTGILVPIPRYSERIEDEHGGSQSSMPSSLREPHASLHWGVNYLEHCVDINSLD